MSIVIYGMLKNDSRYINLIYRYFFVNFRKTIDYIDKKVYNYKEINFNIYGGLTK